MLRQLCTLLLGIFFVSCEELPSKKTDSFNGTWKLDRYEMYDSLSGEWIPDTTRIGYGGFIQYDGTGYMSVQILPDGYNSQVVSDETDSISYSEMKDIAAYYHSNFVYFASYELHGDTVEHSIVSCTESSSVGNVLQRKFEFKDDTLWLMPVPSGHKVSRLKWVKQKSKHLPS